MVTMLFPIGVHNKHNRNHGMVKKTYEISVTLEIYLQINVNLNILILFGMMLKFYHRIKISKI